jgi:hypothetical protein
MLKLVQKSNEGRRACRCKAGGTGEEGKGWGREKGGKGEEGKGAGKEGLGWGYATARI